MGDKKQIAIIGGGTISWVASHFALSAPAYGATARRLERICRDAWPELDRKMYLTKMLEIQLDQQQFTACEKTCGKQDT